ncbi:MAG: cytochrome c [Bacteroidetes bacterium]|nr:cytochrome c [Bacteroidota bacterium]MBL0065112.1 cytochrome c [Bacteroidota bacterium]MBL0138493.1 cytochrome c [Bacteroidota bacterium]
MNSITKSFKSVMAVLALSTMLVSISTQSFAQGKPKGKPWPSPESAVKMKNPVKSDEASLKEGKDLYAQHCKSCHGAKGLGDGTKAEKIDISCGDFSSEETAKATDGELYWKTTEGRKPMPSFKEKLSDNERWAIVNYMRTFTKK